MPAHTRARTHAACLHVHGLCVVVPLGPPPVHAHTAPVVAASVCGPPAGYIFGAAGQIERHCGKFADPEFLAFWSAVDESNGQGFDAPPQQHMYRVRFAQQDLWPGYEGSPCDTVDVEIYQSWLANDDGAPQADDHAMAGADCGPSAISHSHSHGHEHHGHHGHRHGGDNGDDHVHLTRQETEQTAVDLEGSESAGQRLAEALCQVLVDKAVVSREQVLKAIEAVDMLGRGLDGNKIVARAWVDNAFKHRLLTDASSACAELGIAAR